MRAHAWLEWRVSTNVLFCIRTWVHRFFFKTLLKFCCFRKKYATIFDVFTKNYFRKVFHSNFDFIPMYNFPSNLPLLTFRDTLSLYVVYIYTIKMTSFFLHRFFSSLFNLYHILLTNIFFIANKTLLILFIKQKYSTNSKILKNTFLSIINNESQFIFHRIHRKYFPKFHK